MKNKLVVIDDAKNPIKPSPGFAKKELADYHLELCALCGFGCSYCSSNRGNNLRIHHKRLAQLTEEQLGERLLPAVNPELMFVYPDVLQSLRDQLAHIRGDFGEGQTLVVSMLTDAFSPELVMRGVTEQALRLVLERTKFRIRILTKCSIVGTPSWIRFFGEQPHRFVVGLSIGTLDDEWAHRVEKGTSHPAARVRALGALQDAGVTTFGMACPVFPDVLEGDRLERLVDLIRPDVVEHFWAEPFNDRDNWRQVRDGYAPGSRGYQWLTDVFENGRGDLWSAYAAELFSRLRTKAQAEGWLQKLRYLLYETGITPEDAVEFAGLEGVLLQSRPGADGITRSEALRQWDPRVHASDAAERVSAGSASSSSRQSIEPGEPPARIETAAVSRQIVRRPVPTSAFSLDVPEPTRFLFDARIPLEALTSLQGEGGGGKSTFQRWLAARVTRGDLPGDLSEPANVLWLNVEEHASRDIRPGLDRQGADVSRVYRPTDEAPILRFPPDLERLHDTVITLGVRLVVIDQVNAFVPSSREDAVRSTMTGLRKIAEDCCCSILLSRNLNGNKAADAYRRGRGGGLLVDICRANFHMGLHPDDGGDPHGRRVLASIPSNIYGATNRALVISLDAAGRVVLAEEIDLLPGALLARQRDVRAERPDQVAVAVGFLEEFLAGREVPTSDVERVATERGISQRTLNRARAQLDVRHRRVSTRRADGTTAQQTLLRLPGFEPPPEPLPAPGPPAPDVSQSWPPGADDATIRASLIEIDDVGRVDRVGKPASVNGHNGTLPTRPTETQEKPLG